MPHKTRRLVFAVALIVLSAAVGWALGSAPQPAAALAAASPGQDAQTLRNLIRNARKDQQQASEAQPHDGALERKGRGYRDLFQLIKTTLKAAANEGQSDAQDDEQDDEDGDDDV